MFYVAFLLSSEPTGAALSKTGTISLWAKRSSTGLHAVIYNTAKVSCRFVSTGNAFRWGLENGAGTLILDVKTTTAFTVDGLWHHLILSYDLSTLTYQCYVDGVEETLILETSPVVDDTVDWLENALAIGSTTGGGAYFPGCLAEVYVALEYIDLSDSDNLAKFINSDGKPVDLGTDGSTPIGTAPMIYLNKNGERFGDDKSGNGNNLIEQGAPIACATSPSDL